MKLIIVISTLILTSCAFYGEKQDRYKDLGVPVARDYIDQLASASDDYLAYEGTHEIKLKNSSVLYLESVYSRIMSNNEILLPKTIKPRFHIIKNKTPFIFSLPKAQFFISSTLLEKYLKSEELFIAALSAEIIKSSRNVYEKKLMIPLGFYSSEKMILMTRLKPETKAALNEWSYYVLKRSGVDPSAYLNWIQVQNRNTLDFALYLGDALGVTKEEHQFKSFIVKQGVVDIEKKPKEANSSKEFYELLFNIASNK